MLLASGLVAIGLLLLGVGGDLLVRGAVAIARLAGLTPAVIGLTVVALGTSLPELVVSVIASVAGQPDLSVGNVVGSNICNITLILGLTAVIRPLPIQGNVVRIEWPVMFGASVLTVFFAWNQVIGRVEAAVMLALLVLVIVNAIRLARRDVSSIEEQQLTEEVDELAGKGSARASFVAGGFTLVGIGLLMVGGRVLVDGAVQLAELAGMSQRVVGLTVVAVGTSAPEIATSVAAAIKGRSDIAVANLIGSNIMNLLGILGVAGTILPLSVSPAMLASDLWWMLGTAVLLFAVMLPNHCVGRAGGGTLLASYVVYVTLLLAG